MKHLLIILISFLLLPISVFGFDWTVKYDMKQSNVRYDTVILSVPKVIKSFWTLPNQVGIWKCSLSRYDDNDYGSIHSPFTTFPSMFPSLSYSIPFQAPLIFHSPTYFPPSE